MNSPLSGVARRVSAFADKEKMLPVPATTVIQPQARQRRIHSLTFILWAGALLTVLVSAAAGPTEDAAYQRAVTDYKAGRLDAAIPELQTVVRGAPDMEPAHGLLGYLYLRQGKAAQALPELRAAVKLAPDDTSARNNLGDAYLRTGNPSAAITQYRAVLAQTPGDKNARLNLADALTQMGQYADAVTAYRGALGADSPTSAWQNLAYALQKEGKIGEAAQACAQAAQRDPANAQLWQEAGMLGSQAGPSARVMAADALTKALALGTRQAYDALFTRGELYAALGKAPEAAADFAAAAKLRPNQFAPWYNWGAVEAGAGHPAQAEAAYRRALALKPGNVNTRRGLGRLLAGDGRIAAAEGNSDKADAAWEQAIQLNPDDNATRLALADSQMRQKKYDAAAAQYEALARRRPRNASVQIASGLAYEAMGDLSTALAAFHAALTLDPHNAQAQNDLGVVYEKQGDTAHALAAYRKAAALDPSLPEPRKNLARLTQH